MSKQSQSEESKGKAGKSQQQIPDLPASSVDKIVKQSVRWMINLADPADEVKNYHL